MRTLQSQLLAQVPGVRHAFFTRQDGVSTGVYDSLNVGLGSKDKPADVKKNRALCAEELGVDEDHLLTCYQVHSNLAVTTARPFKERPQADALVTTAPRLACGVLSADCAPVLLVDPQAAVVGAAHAGWKGALGGVVKSTVDAMVAKGAQPARILAAVGPCIALPSYEVGEEMEAIFAAEAPGSERFFTAGRTPHKRQFDLPRLVLWRLNQAGVGQAEWVGRDTRAEEDLFYSNRRAFLRGEPDYGRLLSAIVIHR